MIYAVNYDLVGPHRDYSHLYESLTQVGVKILESFWMVSYDGTAVELTQALSQLVDSDDKIFVCEAGDDWGSYNVDSSITQYLG